MTEYIDIMTAVRTVGIYEYLENTEYDDGTLLDFFDRPSDEVETEELYPMIASLTPGQKAGLDFVSLKELLSITITKNAAYENAEYAFLDTISIYDGAWIAEFMKRAASRSRPPHAVPTRFYIWTIIKCSARGP